MKALILVLLLLFPMLLFSANFGIETGLGNLVSSYLSFDVKNGHCLGIGGGYFSYTDEDSEIGINVISPFIVYSTTIQDLFLIRERFSLDYVSIGDGYVQKSYTLFSDFLVFVLGDIYAGVSVPFVIGTEGSSVETVVGTGYLLKF